MTTSYRPPVRTQADLEALWRRLMEPLGFGGHSIWLLVIEGDRPVPQVTEFTEAVEPPDDRLVDNLAEVLERLGRPDRRFAFLRSRPGTRGLTPDDLAWARALIEAARRAGVPCEIVHRASDQDLVAIPGDALIAGDAA